ncbi:DUF4349 domain-containing protein [Rhodopila sp.]|jgi:hypothetical protein|uniref:DUF4349 domain-containing protein n=1 Tax=Rhodopila sp. TaxID=2480087 RepID=UPI002B81E400|nr:DUF4349 domain-containing protein [Rhodopila sp.]HVZ08535.1 DUF4349 domain-containing protein [Rhodopila sp.]
MNRRHSLLCLMLVALALLGACRREAPIRPLPPMAAPMMAAAPGNFMKMRTEDASDRRVAYTQSFVLELPGEGVEPAVRAASQAALSAGGSILHARVDRQPDGSVQGSLSVRIAPDKYKDFVAVLTAPPARLVSQAENAEDKTIASLDIDKRLAAQITLRDRLTQLLAQQGASVGDLVAVEKQLAEVQGTVESLTAQRDYLRTITDTVRVDITYNGLIQQAGPFDISPIRAAMDDFARMVIASTGDMIAWVALALPWVPLGLIGLWLLHLVIRRR